MQATRTDILELSADELVREVATLGAQSFHSRQIASWVYERFVRDFAGMTNLSADLRRRLAAGFTVGRGEVAAVSRAERGATTKLLFAFPDGARVEAVSMREGSRHTACISCQAGCAMGCAFCATGKMGFRRNLSAGEILVQFLEVSRAEGGADRVVFMGMGEPLLNLENVLRAVACLTDTRCFGLGGRRITISTCGITPGIRALTGSGVSVRWALSLNSPFQEQREGLMPIARKYPLAGVLEACDEYKSVTRRRVTVEYVLLGGVNTSREAARGVAKIARRLESKVNLIEYNPSGGCPFVSPKKEETGRFRGVLEAEGVRVTIRFRRGREIGTGCGQLAGEE